MLRWFKQHVISAAKYTSRRQHLTHFPNNVVARSAIKAAAPATTTTTTMMMMMIGITTTMISGYLITSHIEKMNSSSKNNASKKEDIEVEAFNVSNVIDNLMSIPSWTGPRYNPTQTTECDTCDTGSTSTVASSTTGSTASGHQLIFLGSGSSTGCPRPLCSMVYSDLVNGTVYDPSVIRTPTSPISPEVQQLRGSMINQCHTSIKASIGNPIDNKNYRNNPSLLISTIDPTTNAQRNVIIDVGKTFRETIIRWLPKYNIRTIDAIILTHQHMDAAGGLDDVRGVQHYVLNPVTQRREAKPMPIYLSNICFPDVQRQFPWLFPKSQPTTTINDPTVVTRHVASFDVNIFDAYQSFEPIPGLKVTPLPLVHGEDLISYGFAFTIGTMNIVYLSDISRMLPEVLDYILKILPQPIHVLVLDALLIDSTNPVHYCLPQSIELIKQLQPIQTYLVGMNCDSFLSHDEQNELLRKQYGNIQLAHDGLVINIPSSSTTTPPSTITQQQQ